MTPKVQFILSEDSLLSDEDIEIDRLEKCADHLCEFTGHRGGSVGLKICNDHDMEIMHGQFMNDPTTTDVMAFPADDDSEYLGDVAVCHDVARREAETRGHDSLHECQFYILHGVLHLMGLDDKDDSSKNQMLDFQHQALKKEGVVLTS